MSLLLPLFALAFPALMQEPSEQYSELTDHRSEVSNLLPEPMTALAVTSDLQIWSLNPYASTLLRYDVATIVAAGNSSQAQEPDLIIPTGHNPVSLAIWEPPGGERQVLAVCAGTHGMYAYRASDGALLDFVLLESASKLGPAVPPLLSEGADIVVDADNQWAFVSCPSSDSVLKTDLETTGSYFVDDTYHLKVGERPGPLLLETGGPGGADNRVLVAMTVTGNNSIFVGTDIQVGNVFDVSNLLPGQSLPDEDVYLIDPHADTVTPHVRGAGSLLFDMERNPQSDADLWILSSNSINSDISLNTEPLLRGRFLENQLAIVDDDLSGQGPFIPGPPVDLDDDPNQGGKNYSAATSINQARTMAVRSTGSVFIASPFSDHIIVVFSDGNRLLPPWFTLDQGSQCYDLELMANEAILLAYCLGSMKIEIFDRQSISLFGSLSLGLDPTPDQIRRGRDVFLDGTMSADGRFSCASCHPRAMTDQLGWPIADEPIDHKDVMLTQSLLSIADTFPHHWRGERDLKDFQGAFRGLLGATAEDAPSDAQMDDFIAFMQSLEAPANPLQNPRRILDDSRRNKMDDSVETSQGSVIAAASARAGQQLFSRVPNFGGRTCEQCHQMPTGSDGNMSLEVGSAIPRETNIEVPHLRQLQHRSLDLATLDVGGTDVFFNINGFGATHNGGGTDLGLTVNNIFDFVTSAVFQQAFGPAEELMSVFQFIEQFDQGRSPATHWAIRISATDDPAQITADLDLAGEVLIDGFENVRGPWNEVAVDGEVFAGGIWSPFRASLEATTGGNLFIPDDPAFPQFSWDQYRTFAEAQLIRGMITGLPLGNDDRFVRDFDRDGIANAVDPSPWDGDVDDDGFPDGYDETADQEQPDYERPPVRDFVTARLAKYHVKFTEDVTFRVEYSIPGGPLLEYEWVRGDATPGIDDYVDEATFVLTHDHPSGAGDSGTVTYTCNLFATDRAGNPEVMLPLQSFTPDVGGDQDDTEFMLVESVEQVPIPPGTILPAGTDAFAFRITVSEDELASMGIDARLRPEDLAVADWIELAEALTD